ncbi:MAG: undecaprenyldiphospho-muramoylpentapeptide beta-N-acetylglucosaminyltransferase [Oscillospiraceae bacterium]
MRFLFVCGGTAGHINPALAVAGKLKELLPDAEFLFVGAGRELEKKLIPAEGYELKNITITGFSRKLSPSGIKHNLLMLKHLGHAAKESAKIIEDFGPDAVIGMGGYVCYPILKKASELKIPTLMHESNAIPGLTTKILSGTVNRMMVAFPDFGPEYRKPENVVCTGTPVRGSFFNLSKAEARRRLRIPEMPLVVSFWGSLGAGYMNRITAEIVKLNTISDSFYHIHATGGGEKGTETFLRSLAEQGVIKPANTEIRSYIDDMGTVMTAADIIICRAGASTIAELTMLGKAAVFIPSPNVTNDHQTKNAMAVERAGGGRLIPENECTGDRLFEMVKKLLEKPEEIEAMERASKKLGVPDSAMRICSEILAFVN